MLIVCEALKIFFSKKEDQMSMYLYARITFFPYPFHTYFLEFFWQHSFFISFDFFIAKTEKTSKWQMAASI